MESGRLGIIAGDGDFPSEIARAVRRQGRRTLAVGFRDLTDPALEAEVDELQWLRLGEVDALIQTVLGRGIRDVVMAGKVSKDFLFQRRGELRPDARALALLHRLRDHCDSSILAAIADELESEGLQLLSQADLVPNLVVHVGPLGELEPSPADQSDIGFGWSVAKALGAADVGQTVVVKNGAVLAVEAIEGTDAAIRRGGEHGGPGACVIKVAKPTQDRRFDLPMIGPGTLASMLSVGASVLACEAGSTLVLDRATLVAQADAHDIAVVGVDPENVPSAPREEAAST